jgi:tRNA G18 (ribose-2'-O)-methylase SpoU
MRSIVVIAHDIRSRHNIGSLLRTAEGIGIEQVYLTGYTPYPRLAEGDPRLPHLAAKETKEIAKTALGAEKNQKWVRAESVTDLIDTLKTAGYTIAALEQTADSTMLPDYAPPAKIALLLGREVEGIEPELLNLTDIALEIPMFGHKESFNVVQAAAMALYHLRFTP